MYICTPVQLEVSPFCTEVNIKVGRQVDLKQVSRTEQWFLTNQDEPSGW